jgi:hypothetical protein
VAIFALEGIRKEGRRRWVGIASADTNHTPLIPSFLLPSSESFFQRSDGEAQKSYSNSNSLQAILKNPLSYK